MGLHQGNDRKAETVGLEVSNASVQAVLLMYEMGVVKETILWVLILWVLLSSDTHM